MESGNPNTGSLVTPYLQVVQGSRDLLLEFSDPLYISGTIEARNLKFGFPMQNIHPCTIPMTISMSKSKPEIEFQYGGRPFSQIGSSNTSAVD